MIIKAGIHKARKEYHCEGCHKIIRIGQLYSRLFGYAEFGDPPYDLIQHTNCLFPLYADLSKSPDIKKIFVAFEKRGIKLKIEGKYATGVVK